jgi:hypothetical protein
MVRDLAGRAARAVADVRSEGAVSKDRSYTHNVEQYNGFMAQAREMFPHSRLLLSLPENIEPVRSWRVGPAGFLSHEEVAKHTEVADLAAKLAMALEPLVADQTTSPKVLDTLTLDFMVMPELRSIAERDKAELVVAYASGLWKCTILLCGGMAEAMVCDRLRQRQQEAQQVYKQLWPKKESRTVLEWDLYELTTVAARLGEITPDAESMANLLRGWRNLVHPGKEARGEITPKAEEADLAMRMMMMLARDLGRRSGPSPQSSN